MNLDWKLNWRELKLNLNWSEVEVEVELGLKWSEVKIWTNTQLVTSSVKGVMTLSRNWSVFPVFSSFKINLKFLNRENVAVDQNLSKSFSRDRNSPIYMARFSKFFETNFEKFRSLTSVFRKISIVELCGLSFRNNRNRSKFIEIISINFDYFDNFRNDFEIWTSKRNFSIFRFEKWDRNEMDHFDQFRNMLGLT